jgi:hypothetical protein
MLAKNIVLVAVACVLAGCGDRSVGQGVRRDIGEKISWIGEFRGKVAAVRVSYRMEYQIGDARGSVSQADVVEFPEILVPYNQDISQGLVGVDGNGRGVSLKMIGKIVQVDDVVSLVNIEFSHQR